MEWRERTKKYFNFSQRRKHRQNDQKIKCKKIRDVFLKILRDGQFTNTRKQIG